MTCEQMHKILITPIFIKDGINYLFEGLTEDEKEHRGRNFEFRFIVDTLRKYFGDNLDFEDNGNNIIIETLSNTQMKILREINEDTCDHPIKYKRSQLKFKILEYNIKLV